MNKQKTRRQYPEDFRSLAGFSGVVFANTFATTALSIFMLFLTDFSGIDTAMGKAGAAAAFGTLFLLVTRIVDAVDDPLQGWLMDSAKECPFGKYRKFGILGTFLVGAGAIMLFAMPAPVKGNTVMLWVWSLIGYLMLDMGGAMNVSGPIMQKATTDARVRTKITSVLRFAIVIAAIPTTFFVPIVTAFNGNDGDIGKTAVKVATAFAVVSCLITFLGIALLKEPYRKSIGGEKGGSAVKFSEILEMLRKNKPLWAHNFGFFVGNMSYSLSNAVMVYFLKWYFCADTTTGDADLVKFAALSGIFAVISLVPNFLAPFLTGLVMRLCKTVDRGMQFCMMLLGSGYLVMFILNLTGLMRNIPALFFILYFIIMMPSSMSTIFAGLMNADCADYAEYVTGKNMTAISNSIYGIICKGQNAIGGVIPGILLIAVGYSVNASTGAYAGNLAEFPRMVSGLAVIATLIPGLLGITAFLIYRLCYRVTPELRATITDELNQRHANKEEEIA